MEFRTNYTPAVKMSMGKYEKIQKQYGLLMEKDGTVKPGVIGEYDAYQMRQEAVESTLLSNIVKRFVKGDETAIGKVNGGFIDLTDMPTDLMGLHGKLTVAKNQFDNLPVEIRSKYGNNFNNYLADYENILKTAKANSDKLKENIIDKKTEVKENE